MKSLIWPTTHRYISPRRPLDIGFAAREGNVEIDWDNTTIGEWTPETVYAFQTALPDRVVEGLTLEEVTT